MKARRNNLKLLICGSIILAGALSGCSVAGPLADEMNPYGQGGFFDNSQGTRDNGTILNASGGGAGEAERARHQMDVSMGLYRRAAMPQPAYPVVRPAEVRKMWIPDHLNKHGDLVPAHYYFLRVMNDSWEVQDAFEYDQQLQNTQYINYSAPATAGAAAAAPQAPAPGGAPMQNYGMGQGGSSTPWVYKEGAK